MANMHFQKIFLCLQPRQIYHILNVYLHTKLLNYFRPRLVILHKKKGNKKILKNLKIKKDMFFFSIQIKMPRFIDVEYIHTMFTGWLRNCGYCLSSWWCNLSISQPVRRTYISPSFVSRRKGFIESVISLWSHMSVCWSDDRSVRW